MDKEYVVNPMQWFSERKLSFKPKHFVTTSTPVTEESLLWIINTLQGRYAMDSLKTPTLEVYISSQMVPCFEDPKEAVLYELTWS